MIVVSDTSAITALLKIGLIELLRDLFGSVIIPTAVERELMHEHPTLPSWITVGEVANSEAVSSFRSKDIHSGEAEAIQLAKEVKADRLLIDDHAGRRAALTEGLTIIGLLGVTLLAKRNGLIPSARVMLRRLRDEAHVYLAEDLVEEALRTTGE